MFSITSPICNQLNYAECPKKIFIYGVNLLNKYLSNNYMNPCEPNKWNIQNIQRYQLIG